MNEQGLLSSIRRGHLLPRAWGRLVREIQAVITRIVLGLAKPKPSCATVCTLNADEENASVMTVLLGSEDSSIEIRVLSPEPEVAEYAVAAAARRLKKTIPPRVRYLKLGYLRLLNAYAWAERTYSTHVLLPGIDPSGRREHFHLTHGSGFKPDTTFRGPTTVLASITPEWVSHQLREYKLPPDTRVVELMPRLEVMRLAIQDKSILTSLGLETDKKLAVWAPTYRSIQRRNSEIRVSGQRFSPKDKVLFKEATALIEEFREAGWNFIIKVHPLEFDDLSFLPSEVWTNADLRYAGITPYELFGVCDLLITDYSSLAAEREAVGRDWRFFGPDIAQFRSGYRGLRTPLPPALMLRSRVTGSTGEFN